MSQKIPIKKKIEFNDFEKEILKYADIKCKWKRTHHRNAAFTLSYGRMIIGKSYKGDKLDDPPYLEDEEKFLPCCWENDFCRHDGHVLFEGIHLFVLPYTGQYDKFEDLSKHTEADDETNIGIRSNPSLFPSLQSFWSRYFNLKDQTILDALSPETYKDIIRPDVYDSLEKRFNLTGASWWYLPSDCYSCS